MKINACSDVIARPAFFSHSRMLLAGIHEFIDSRHFRRRTSSSSRKVLRAWARALRRSGMTQNAGLLRRPVGLLAMTLVFTLFVFLFNPAPSYSVVEPDLTNVLGNPSFEEALGTSIGGGLGNWDNTPNRGLSNPVVAGAPNGSRALQLNEATLGAGSAGAFTFQVVSNAGGGDFVTFSAFVRMTAVDGDGTDAQLQIEFNDGSGRRISATNTGDLGLGVSAVFTRATVSATAPTGTKQVVFTIRLNTAVDTDGTGTTVALFDSAVGTISKFPFVMDVSASKPYITKGSATFISSRIKNISALAFPNLELVAKIPEGFNFIDSASRVDGAPASPREGSKIFSLGTISSGESRRLGFLLVASNMVQIGKKYEVSFFVRQTNGTIQSATKLLILTIVADPLFDEGTILGKVFDDRNENGFQDKGEYGVPGVKLATEQGIVVVTDPHGRYHIPAIRPGRHIVKIDGHTLPQATKFVSEESVLIKSTEGIMSVVNFAVKLPEPQIPKQYRDQLNVLITQGNDTSVPVLSIAIDPEILRMGVGYFERDPVFAVKTNYVELISGWRIEIRDEFGDEIWTGYGLGSPPKEAPWSGKTKAREPVKSGVYSYRLIVRDRDGHEDWTRLNYFRVVSKLDKAVPDEPKLDVPAVGNMSIDRDGKRSIPISARPTLYVRGTTVPWNKVVVNGEPVGINLDGTFQTELFTQPGKQSVQITTTDPEGNAIAYQEEVVVKDSYFFMVGLGEEEIGTNIIKGNEDVVGREERFHHDFYQDGRLAYYLKGKIKGKFLVTSRYDTDDPKSELFTNLDPDRYYPVYGDNSEIDYEAYNTKQRFYILIEVDRSSLKWGSFNTNFTDTELATHNRTFSGLKIKHETLSSTRYGDAKRGFVVYGAKNDQLADHNEFSGTGGSLFYLRNKNVIQGSEKVRIEVRDQIQEIATYSRDLAYGTDYEIDYPAGRIILRKPLSAVSYSDTIISNDVLSGSDTYLIVDYEFDAQGMPLKRNSGIRGFTHIGDHFRIGGTALEEKRDGRDYDLRGVDLVSKFGRNTKITAEYAKSQERTARNSVSFNGGITFTDVPTGNKVIKKGSQRFDDAYLIKAETKAKTGTEISGYVQQITAGFANADLIRQAGTRKAGAEIRQKVAEHVQLSYRMDRQRATDPDNTAGVFVTSPKDGWNHTAQAKADYDRYLGIVEYRHQKAIPYPTSLQSLRTVLDEVQFENAAATKLGYRVHPDFMPYGKIQTTWGGHNEPNHQFGGGIEASVLKGKGTVHLEELAGTVGDSTELGFDVKTSETQSVYSALRTGPDPESQGRVMSTTIGSSSQVNSKSRFYSERELASYRKGERTANILGYDTKLNDKWGAGFSFERSQLYDIREVNSHRNAGALEISYLDKDLLKIISRYELRYDGELADQLQWLFRDTVDWKINEDYSFAARFNRSDTNRLVSSGFDRNAMFTEFNAGVAYRPVRHNRLNVLTRYTWLEEVGAESQFNTPDIFGIPVEESAHIVGAEFGYEVLPPFLGLVEKFAYRRTSIGAEGFNYHIGNFMWANRLNFHIIRKWDLALEYRMLWDVELLEAMKHGALVEIDREIADYIRFGIGYNFTDFDDDLREMNDFSSHGFFTRVSGKF